MAGTFLEGKLRGRRKKKREKEAVGTKWNRDVCWIFFRFNTTVVNMLCSLFNYTGNISTIPILVALSLATEDTLKPDLEANSLNMFSLRLLPPKFIIHRSIAAEPSNGSQGSKFSEMRTLESGAQAVRILLSTWTHSSSGQSFKTRRM